MLAVEEVRAMLSQTQRDQFWRDGFLVAEDAVTQDQLRALNETLSGWVEESRRHDKPFGPPCKGGRARFDMGAEHSPERPALRRVNNPSDISPAFEAVMKSSAMTEMIADLLGGSVKFHHCKINLKLPSSQTEVGYHQDFSFTPHTNDDIVTALLMLDDVTMENGPLMVVPGSHREVVYSLYHDARFTGTIGADHDARFRREEVPAIGKAGSVCLMHTRVVHGSRVNRSPRSRNLYICVYTAADAFPLCPNPLPSVNEGVLVRGRESIEARLTLDRVELPPPPSNASFFATQGQRSAG
jgi:phytanoyl-CoA hydroxylase